MFDITIIEKSVGIINSTANVIMLYILFKRFLGFRINKLYIILIMAVTVNLPSLTARMLNIDGIYEWILISIYTFILSLIFCKGTYFKKFISVVIYTCLGELVQYTTIPLIYVSYYINIGNSSYKTNLIRMLINQSSVICSTLLFIFIINFITKHFFAYEAYGTLKYGLLFTIPNIFIVIILCEYFKIYYITNGTGFNSLFGNIKMIVLSSMALICSLFIIIISDKLLKENKLHEKELLLKHQFDMQSKHYKNLQKQFENTKVFRHDLNNHLICIKNLMDNNDIKNAEKYVEKITKSVESLNLKVNTANPFADAVISEKYNICINKNIEFKCNVKIPNSFKIDPFDLCVLLANALDNAIEACEKITHKNISKFIHIRTILNKSFIIFEVKNSIEGCLNENNLTTDKDDTVNHGLGLLSIKNTANKYLGTTYIETSENLFTLNIMLQT
ncbi:GHKL domain-containing protein [Clostridium sp. JS66]|uniref:sensor histidine kinase n=1 Tax=Clostridium sp. JS66 TaxID=3064705 RepID=UPI00298D89A6|nr:GHKL domain-containing protein [Clostridium sp. JS66]WPC39438.1 GHKL domain-containing protein [Clostridium sp. JS66]